MKLENQVISFDLAQRLKELGVKQDSLFYWDNETRIIYAGRNFYENNKKIKEYYSAFTVSELGDMLPDCIIGKDLFNNKNTTLINLNGHLLKSYKKDNDYQIYIDGLTKIISFCSKNEANASALMLIYLIENNLIDINKVNNG